MTSLGDGLRLFCLVALSAPAAVAGAQGPAPNSCWGRCGYFAQDSAGNPGCLCDSACETAGNCCADKHTYCSIAASAPVCPLIGNGPKSTSGAQVTSGVYPNIYGTDLGFTYSHAGSLNILFGDSWLTNIWGNRNNACPLPPFQDDIHARLKNTTRPSWIPTSPRETQPWQTNTCQKLLDIDLLPPLTSGFAPITVLANSGGASQDMGWLKTPVGGFSDGTNGYGIFERVEYQPCFSNFECDLAAPGQGLVCSTAAPPFSIVMAKYCVDPSAASYGIPTHTPVHAAMFLDIGRQTGKRYEYVRGLKFLTAKMKNPAVRTVRAFDPATNTYDLSAGSGALLMWGRPEFVTPDGGEVPMFFMYQPLPLMWFGDIIINWSPRFYAGLNANGVPQWTTIQRDAVALKMQTASPTYADSSLAMQASVAYVAELRKWVMLYGGDVADWQDRAMNNEQPRTGSIHLRTADFAWGPWSAPVPALDRYQAAPYLACDSVEPVGFDFDRSPADGIPDSFATPGPWQHPFEPLADAVWKAGCTQGDPIRPNPQILQTGVTCVKSPVGKSAERGNFYSPNIITEWTATGLPASVSTYARKATLYWNVSTWNPYQTLVVSTLIELPDPDLAYDVHKYQLRANGTGILVRAPANGTVPAVDGHRPQDAEAHVTVRKVGIAGSNVIGQAYVSLQTPRGYLARLANNTVGFTASAGATAQWQAVYTQNANVPHAASIALRQQVSGVWRYMAVSGSSLTTQTADNTAARFRLTWRCEAGDVCGLSAN